MFPCVHDCRQRQGGLTVETGEGGAQVGLPFGGMVHGTSK